MFNMFVIWLVALNFILLSMTIPNIKNPGPINNELSVMYNNVHGFVNIRKKNGNPDLFNRKISDFHGHIFGKKPDIVILNETWLMSHIFDSEIFPNNSYKVFRRDRSRCSHPDLVHYKNGKSKFKKNAGGVLIAIRSDLDIKSTEYISQRVALLKLKFCQWSFRLKMALKFV